MKTYKDFIEENFDNEDELDEFKNPFRRGIVKRIGKAGGGIVKKLARTAKGFSAVKGTKIVKKQSGAQQAKFAQQARKNVKGKSKARSMVTKMKRALSMRKRKAANI